MAAAKAHYFRYIALWKTETSQSQHLYAGRGIASQKAQSNPSGRVNNGYTYRSPFMTKPVSVFSERLLNKEIRLPIIDRIHSGRDSRLEVKHLKCKLSLSQKGTNFWTLSALCRRPGVGVQSLVGAKISSRVRVKIARDRHIHMRCEKTAHSPTTVYNP